MDESPQRAGQRGQSSGPQQVYRIYRDKHRAGTLGASDLGRSHFSVGLQVGDAGTQTVAWEMGAAAGMRRKVTDQVGETGSQGGRGYPAWTGVMSSWSGTGPSGTPRPFPLITPWQLSCSSRSAPDGLGPQARLEFPLELEVPGLEHFF